MRDFSIKFLITRPDPNLQAFILDILGEGNVDVSVANIRGHRMVSDLLELASCTNVSPRVNFAPGPSGQSGMFVSFLGEYEEGYEVLGALRSCATVMYGISSNVDCDLFIINSKQKLVMEELENVEQLEFKDLWSTEFGSLMESEYDFAVKTLGLDYLEIPEIEITLVPYRARRVAAAILNTVGTLLVENSGYRVGHLDMAPDERERIQLEIDGKVIHLRLIFGRGKENYQIAPMVKGISHITDVLYELCDDKKKDEKITEEIRKSAQEELEVFDKHVKEDDNCLFVKKKFEGLNQSYECLWAKVVEVTNAGYVANLVDVPRLRIDLPLKDPIVVRTDEIMDWAVVSADGRVLAGHFSSIWRDQK